MLVKNFLDLLLLFSLLLIDFIFSDSLRVTEKLQRRRTVAMCPAPSAPQ